jgi:hypothetical protein
LRVLGAIGATCAYPFATDELYGQTALAAPHAGHQHEPIAAAAPLPTKLLWFKPEDFALVQRIADLIIPPTDTPGASAAGAPQYADMVISSNPQFQRIVQAGLQWMRALPGKPFAERSEAEQTALLLALDKPQPKRRGPGYNPLKGLKPEERFFVVMKNLIVDGYYTSEPGLLRELGYAGNQAMGQFGDCVAEH